MKTTVFCSVALASALMVASCGNAAPAQVSQDGAPSLEAAGALMEGRDFAGALEGYLEAMESSPASVDAHIGAARAEIELGSYECASSELELALRLAPTSTEAIETLAVLCERSGRPETVERLRDAIVAYARRMGHAGLAEAPSADVAPGNYDVPQSVALIGESDDAVIWYRLVSGDTGLKSSLRRYEGPFTVGYGSTTVEAFAVSDGMPSDIVTLAFRVMPQGGKVEFTDGVVERMVRAALGMPDGDLSPEDVIRLRRISSCDLAPTADLSVSTLEDLSMLTNLEGIDLRGQTLTDLSPLAACPYLTSLHWEGGKLDNLDALAGMCDLTELSVADNAVSDISGIGSCPQLRSVDLHGNEVSDLTPLAECRSLRTLSVDDVCVLELACMPWLRHVTVWGFDFDRSAASELTWLETLSITRDMTFGAADGHSVALSDLAFLEKLDGCRSLTLYCVDDPAELVHLHGLRCLTSLRMPYSDALGDPDAVEGLMKELPQCRIQ